jgi:hypothetical protein
MEFIRAVWCSFISKYVGPNLGVRGEHSEIHWLGILVSVPGPETGVKQ